MPDRTPRNNNARLRTFKLLIQQLEISDKSVSAAAADDCATPPFDDALQRATGGSVRMPQDLARGDGLTSQGSRRHDRRAAVSVIFSEEAEVGLLNRGWSRWSNSPKSKIVQVDSSLARCSVCLGQM